jgi:hypothetical protein
MDYHKSTKMERTFTIFRQEFRYEKRLDRYHLLFSSGIVFKTLSREDFIVSLSHHLRVCLRWTPDLTWDEMTRHTCRNKEMKRRLENYLAKALEICQAGGIEEYKLRLKVKRCQVFLKHWKFPTDLERNVMEYR